MRDGTGGGESEEVPTLADLITRRKRERGWSYRQLQERSHDVITYGRWQQLGSGVRLTEFPEPTTLQAIADALEVDVTAVVLSTALSIGLGVRHRRSEFAAMLPAYTELLDDDQRDALLGVVRTMVSAQRRLLGAQMDPEVAAAMDWDAAMEAVRANRRLSARDRETALRAITQSRGGVVSDPGGEIPGNTRNEADEGRQTKG